MREIIFKAKRTDNGEWESGRIIHSERNVGGEINECFICRGFADQADVVMIQVDPETVCQYTGLTDKNGNKIFEGDIIGGCNGSINGKDWTITPFAVVHTGVKFDLPYYCWTKDGSNDMDSTHWCEVIGNIFDNPELLKQ